MTPTDHSQPWKISAKRSLFAVNVQDLWHYRDLLLLLVRRDLVSFYKQTILGPIWFLAQPLITTIIFNFVFSHLAGLSTDGLPGPLFYLAGITCWAYFSECILRTASVFRDNANLFGKVYFPRLIMPLSIVVSNLVRFSLQFFLFLVVMLYYTRQDSNVHPNVYMLLLPLLVLLIASLGLGAGMIISALTTKYRDLAFLLTFGIQLLMYLTPVFMPLSATPEKFRWLIRLNPMTHIIETFRYAFLGRGSFAWSDLFYTTVFIIFIMAAGVIIFTRVEKNFIDTV